MDNDTLDQNISCPTKLMTCSERFVLLTACNYTSLQNVVTAVRGTNLPDMTNHSELKVVQFVDHEYISLYKIFVCTLLKAFLRHLKLSKRTYMRRNKAYDT